MLLQTIIYQDDFPINIRVSEIKNVPLHYHSDVEFVVVLSGEINLTNGYGKFTLSEGEIFTNNGNEIHSLSSCGSSNMVAVIQISNSFFTKYFPTLGKSIYRTNSIKTSGSKQNDLLKMILMILLQYFKKDSNYKNDCINGTIELINYLNKNFNLFTFENRLPVSASEENPIIIERVSRIISYIYENYKNKITLDNIAENEHLSMFYLSHLIKEYTGMGFREFLCFARAERSEIPLLDTSRKISIIAKDVGFSTTDYYKKFFEKWYGHSPEEHRTLNQPLIMSNLNPARLEDAPDSTAATAIKGLLYGLDVNMEL
ncbi:MAG: helix-turn-helix transcriptional regulator [Firmicutes bacterium]|nr:helix-turn-helix transcriptional regulator [Bacillota bacterium]